MIGGEIHIWWELFQRLRLLHLFGDGGGYLGNGAICQSRINSTGFDWLPFQEIVLTRRVLLLLLRLVW